MRRPAGLPPAPHQPQRRGRPEPPSAAEDEDDAYLLAKSYFDMKARPAPAPPQPALRAPCDAAPPRRSAPLLSLHARAAPGREQGAPPLGAGRARRGRAQEYRRAAHALRGAAGPRAMFLRGYTRYLAGERRREEERVEAAGPLGKADAANAVRAPARPLPPPPAPACAAPRRLSRAGPTWSAPAAAAGARCDPAASMSLCSFIHPHAQLAARCFRATSWPGRPARTAARGRQCLASQAGALRAPTVKGHAGLGCSRGRRMRGQASLLAAA